ncbi:MAG: cyclic lactone autoinducer peptide [Anaerovorax sp.]|nr:cyclic lactone autoinducer peptide [Anaerovorax sp.]
MIKKMHSLLLSTAASFLFVVADLTLNSTSLIHHGEPDCPEELLK